MKDWQEQEGAFDRARKGLSSNMLYSRTEACRAMGLSNAAFARDFKDNVMYLAYGEEAERIGPRGTYYRGSELLKQLERLADPLQACLIYVEYIYETDEQFKKDHGGKSKRDVFRPGAYLSIIGYIE